MRPWYRFGRIVADTVMRLAARPVFENRERVPQRGGLIVAANHVSYWDPPLMGFAVGRETHYLAKEELFRLPLLGRLIRSLNAIPVRRGLADLRGIQQAIAALKAGGCLVLFPEGGRSRSGRLQRAKPGVGLLVAHARVPVMPAYVVGSDRSRHWFARRERVRIRFGRLLTVEELLGGETETGKALYQRVADRVLEEITRVGREMAGTPSAAPGPTERGAIP